jgi:L-seryl-tRNA(Ser) seleniumtransferase
LRLAALESTLDAHSRGRLDLLPVWSFLEADSQTLRERAECIAGKVDAEAVATEAVIGGGSVPGATLSSWGIRLAGDPDRLAMQLRAGDPPVIGRIVDGDFIVDLRAVPRDDDKLIVTAIAGLSRESS